MGEIKTFFFDSYAFFELIFGNENYKPYAKDTTIITTRLNLMELHYGMMSKYGKDFANQLYDEYSTYCVDVDDYVFKKASELKYSLKQRHVSYIDCVGYVLAKLRNVPFLTGDKQFQDLDNVEFVE